MIAGVDGNDIVYGVGWTISIVLSLGLRHGHDGYVVDSCYCEAKACYKHCPRLRVW